MVANQFEEAACRLVLPFQIIDDINMEDVNLSPPKCPLPIRSLHKTLFMQDAKNA
jgi:hypothetical protein